MASNTKGLQMLTEVHFKSFSGLLKKIKIKSDTLAIFKNGKRMMDYD